MSEGLCSVGLDVGTTSTQLIVSRLTVENRASSFTVPEMEISQREVIYRSGVYFTPLVEDQLVDGAAIREIVENEYRKAGITRDAVDTGAIIITGETSRKENAAAVLEALSDLAGDFVVATAGPDLESVLAAKGAGAVEHSRDTGKTVLHMDIGGGTSNLALIREGKILETGCFNVGGRLVKLDARGTVTYVSPVLAGITGLKPGNTADQKTLTALAQTLTEALEMAAGLREPTDLMEALLTKETGKPWHPPREAVMLSFSGGVADCIGKAFPDREFGDIGPLLGRAIRESRLCQGAYILGQETIRATVIGAGCHSTQLSGSTVFHQNVVFPLKNVPVVDILEESAVKQELSQQGDRVVYHLPEQGPVSYREITDLAQGLMEQIRGAYLLCMQQDMAKALGQALALRLPEGTPILCLDRVQAGEGSYLDVGAPVGGAMPVVVKTLVLGS